MHPTATLDTSLTPGTQYGATQGTERKPAYLRLRTSLLTMSFLGAVGRNQPRSALAVLPSPFSGRPKGRQQCLKLLAALTANLHMFLDEWHSLGGVQAAEFHIHEAV